MVMGVACGHLLTSFTYWLANDRMDLEEKLLTFFYFFHLGKYVSFSWMLRHLICVINIETLSSIHKVKFSKWIISLS
jgi:hypothetical protein